MQLCKYPKLIIIGVRSQNLYSRPPSSDGQMLVEEVYRLHPAQSKMGHEAHDHKKLVVCRHWNV